MVGYGRGGWGERSYLCLVPSASFANVTMDFKKCYNQNDSTFIKFAFVTKPSFSVTRRSIKGQNEIMVWAFDRQHISLNTSSLKETVKCLL